MSQSIADLDGVTAARAEKLRRAGFETIPDLAASTVEAIRAGIKGAGGRITVSEAESLLADATAAEARQWRRAASFVVSFEVRGEEADRTRRTVVEQTELDGEAPAEDWPGWECSQLCDWMQDRLGPPPAPPDAADPDAVADGAAGDDAMDGERPGFDALPIHQIVGTALVDAHGVRTEIVGVKTRLVLARPPMRIIVTIVPVPDRPALGAARFRDAVGGRVVAGPTSVEPGQTTFALTVPTLPGAVLDLVVAVWDPDARAAPTCVAVTLAFAAAAAADAGAA